MRVRVGMCVQRIQLMVYKLCIGDFQIVIDGEKNNYRLQRFSVQYTYNTVHCTRCGGGGGDVFARALCVFRVRIIRYRIVLTRSISVFRTGVPTGRL